MRIKCAKTSNCTASSGKDFFTSKNLHRPHLLFILGNHLGTHPVSYPHMLLDERLWGRGHFDHQETLRTTERMIIHMKSSRNKHNSEINCLHRKNFEIKSELNYSAHPYHNLLIAHHYPKLVIFPGWNKFLYIQILANVSASIFFTFFPVCQLQLVAN